MILKKFTFPVFVTAVLTACSGGGGAIVVNDGITATDSVSLQRIDTLTLHIGSRIRSRPACSQLLDDSISPKYIILDEQKLNIFELDTAGVVSKTYQIPENLLKEVSPEPIDGSRIIVENGTAILSGLPLSGKSRFYKEDPVSVMIDIQAGTIKPGASFSDEYSKAFFGGLYFNTIYQCKGDNKKIVYSFPASNYISRYDTDLCMIDSLYMGSRYTKEIKPDNSNPINLLRDKDARLKYYLDENSYSIIAFDEHNGIYYRIANHPLKIDRGENHRRPFSIIAMDSEGKLISETPVVEDYYNIVTPNCHVYQGGLLLQLISENKDEMKFVYYKLTPQR